MKKGKRKYTKKEINEIIMKAILNQVKESVSKILENREEVYRLVEDGHNYRCAFGIVFHDNDCQCDKYKLG